MQEQLEKARKRLRICLIAVVLLAIVAGCAYYFGDFGKERDVTEGTLVRGAQDAQGDVRMPYSENMSKTEDWGRNLTAGASGGSVYGCR